MLSQALLTAWCSIAVGILSGALIGLFFHRDDWLGGYGSWRRRLLRLGHIACFGLAGLNLAFAITLPELDGAWAALAGIAFVIGTVSMPSVCFLSAWRKPMRHAFPIPVLAIATGCTATIGGLL
jgi:hypothetical protein